MIKKFLYTLSVAASLLGVVFFYGNCSSDHSQSDQSSTGGFVSGTCSLTGPDHLFALTYHPFLQRECVQCHISGGRKSDMPFASPGLDIAYGSFSQIGYKHISLMAITPHGGGSGGRGNPTEVDELKKLWLLGTQELKTCKEVVLEEFVTDPWKDVRVHSKSKGINPNLQGVATVEWDLNTDMLTPPAGVVWPSAPGAKFKLDFTVDIRGGASSYLVSRPRLEYPTQNTQAVDLNLKSIRIKLNGKEVINETTFHYLDKDARKNSNTFLSAGAMVALGSLKTTDVVAVSFGQVQAIVMPPIPPAPTIEFVSTALTTAENGYVNIPLQLSSAIDDFVSVTYTIGGGTSTTIPAASIRCFDASCPTIRNDAGNEVRIKNFDRDYTLVGLMDQEITVDSNQVVAIFEPNQTSLTLKVKIFPDQRDEPNEIFSMTLTGASSALTNVNVSTTKKRIDVSITDDDAAAANGAITFSRLMTPGGAFMVHCIRCHHATNNDVLERDYDMTTYDNLLLRNRVVPNNVNDSLIWRRINGRDENNNSVEPMPQGGLLDTDAGLQHLDDIRNWILGGARNN